MSFRFIFLTLCILLLSQSQLRAQRPDSLFNLSAIIYDESFAPVSASHVININTHQGDVTDSLGIFRLPAHRNDTLLVRNIAFRDTLVPVLVVLELRHVRLKRMHYKLQEAKVFEWGSTYDDFREAFIGMPMQQTLGASMGLPQQDPDKVPVEMDEKAVKNVGLLLTSPISYFYYNFSQHAKSARKVYRLKKNQDKQGRFEAVVSKENLSEITGLIGPELEEFQVFLSARMICSIHCSELEIYSEIYGLWNVYQDLKARGMLNTSQEIREESKKRREQ